MSEKTFVTVTGCSGFDAWIVGRSPKTWTGEVIKFYDGKRTALVKRDSDGKLFTCELSCLTVNQPPQ